MATRGFFFERVGLQSGLFGTGKIAENVQDQLVGAHVSDSQMVQFASTMTATHKNAGFVRGNSQVSVIISLYNRMNVPIFDLRGYDYDTVPVDIQLLVPTSQYSNNAFANTIQYVVLKQIALASQDPASAPSIGVPVGASYSFLALDWEVVFLTQGQV